MSEEHPSTPPQPARSPHAASPRVLLILSVIGALVFAASFAFVLYLFAWQDLGEVGEGTFLEVTLRGEVPDAPVAGGIALEPDDFPPIVTEISAALRRAATDERIEGVFLVLDNPSLGWGAAQEVRAGLVELRSAGKPCVAYGETLTTGAYHLASACDEVVMAPAGIGLIYGISATTTYYAATLEKLGAEAEMLHVGDFKTAVEPYERTEPSEAAQLAMDEMLDSLWTQWLEAVAEGRGVPVDQVQAWVNTPSLSPEEALERGIVDALAYPSQVRARAHTAGSEGFLASLSEPVTEEPDAIDEHYTPLKEYLKDLRASWRGAEAQVAVVHAAGPIVSGRADGGLFGATVLADRTFASWMEEVREDDAIKAVVVRVDSPGGSASASDMMWHEIQRTQQAGKPVVVSMANYAASGGYYISAPADWIVAQPATLTGSIGVFGGKINLAGTYDKIGLTQWTAKRGDLADLLSMTSSFSEEGRTVYRTFLEDFYETFLSRVATGRDLTRDQAHEVAQGRVWTGEQALERGLVDELGGIEAAIAKASELAGIEDPGIERWPKRKGFFDLLLEDLEGGGTVEVSLLPGLDVPEVRDLMLLERILAGGADAAALLPGHLVIR